MKASVFSVSHLLVTCSDKEKAIPGSSSGHRPWQEGRLWNHTDPQQLAEILGPTTQQSPRFRRQPVVCTLNKVGRIQSTACVPSSPVKSRFQKAASTCQTSPQNPHRQLLQAKYYAKSFLPITSNSLVGLISLVGKLRPQEEARAELHWGFHF